MSRYYRNQKRLRVELLVQRGVTVWTEKSIQGVPVRLTYEVWRFHILEARPGMEPLLDLLKLTIREPERVFLGRSGEFTAIRRMREDRWLAVVYRLLDDDGFVITAFPVGRETYFRNRRQVWP